MVTPFWQSKPPIYLGRARRESLHAQAPHRAGDGLVSGHRVNLLERYDYPYAHLRQHGSAEAMLPRMQTRAELYDLIGLRDYEALDASLVTSVLPSPGAA